MPRPIPSLSAARLLRYAGAASQRAELRTHERDLGLPRQRGLRATVGGIVRAELERARAADPRNTPALMGRLMHRFERAQTRDPGRVRVLFGFSRLIDAKVTVSPKLFESSAGHFDEAEVLKLIDRPPPPSGPIDTLAVALAHLIRHQIVGQGKPLQLSITPEVASRLSAWLEARGVPVQKDPGGAANVGANLASAFKKPIVRFTSAGALSPEQAATFSDRVRIVTPGFGMDGRSARDPHVTDATAATKINYVFELPGSLELSVLGRKQLFIDGQLQPCDSAHTHGRVILSTEASFEPTFDTRFSRRELRELARGTDVFVAAGLHYITGYDPVRLGRTAHRLRRQLLRMRAANQNLYVHYQYVVPKNPANEASLFAALHGVIDSLSMNATELAGLVANLDGRVVDHHADPLRWTGGPLPTDRTQAEDPERIYEMARHVLAATGVERLHVHGIDVDFILVRGGDGERMRREGDGALKARQIAVNKASTLSGSVKSAANVKPVLPTLRAEGVTAVQRFADGIARHHGLSEREREALVTDGTFIDPTTGLGISITSARTLHLLRGGLVSMGDHIDITALLTSFQPQSALARVARWSHRLLHANWLLQ